METIKYWWKLVIWHPVDIADKILLLVGAISGFLYKGDNPVLVDLAWQIPVGVVGAFLIWRLLQTPVKIRDDLRRERRGEYPLTFDGIGKQITKIEDALGKLQEKIDPQCIFDIQDIRQKIFCNYETFDYSMIGGITRAVVFVFKVTNASSIWITTTGNTKGDLKVQAEKLMGVHWQANCNGIEPGHEGELRILLPVSERFANTLAFLPIDGSFSAEFSEMLVEFEARDNSQRQTIGYIPIGKQYDIPIEDHPAFQKIRKLVEFEEQLGHDKRITR